MNVRTECSRESLLRFIKLYLSLKDTPHWFHQTLTLGEQIEDFKTAKQILKKLLDALEREMAKEFQMATIYIMGRQENMRVHFHLVFFFYGQPSLPQKDLRVRLSDAVWNRWRKLNPYAERHANWLRLGTKSNGLWYLMQHFKIAKTEKEKGKPLPMGIRNRKLIAANSSPVSAQAVRDDFESHFPVPFRKIYFSILAWPKERYGSRSLKAERKLVRECSLDRWEKHKSNEVEKVTGVQKPIGNDCFIKFRKKFGFRRQ